MLGYILSFFCETTISKVSQKNVIFEGNKFHFGFRK